MQVRIILGVVVTMVVLGICSTANAVPGIVSLKETVSPLVTEVVKQHKDNPRKAKRHKRKKHRKG